MVIGELYILKVQRRIGGSHHNVKFDKNESYH